MISDPTIKTVPFNVSGGYVATYPFTFRFFGGDIKCRLTKSDGYFVELVEGIDYSVSAPGDSGNVTKIAAWPAAATLTVYRQSLRTQTINLRNNDIPDAEVYETAIDHAIAIVQELAENLDRTIRFPIVDVSPISDMPTAAVRSGRVLGFDSLGNPQAMVGLEAVSASDYGKTLVQAGDIAAALVVLGGGTTGKSLFATTTKAAAQAIINGSGLDSDTLDGIHAAGFRAAGDKPATAGDADMVSGCGIGAYTVLANNYNIDTLVKPGNYYVYSPKNTAGAVIANYDCVISVNGKDAGNVVQNCILFGLGRPTFLQRALSGGTWFPGVSPYWDTVWNTNTDGNVGQPPAPKPTKGTPAGGANGVGQRLSGTAAGGSTLYRSGSSNLTGIWDITAVTFITASGSFLGMQSEIDTGSMGVVGAANTVDYVTTRVS